MDAMSILSAALPAPLVRLSTEEDLWIAQQRPMFHTDALVEMTYNLGGAVAIDDDGQIFRAPDDKIALTLAKALAFNVISEVKVDDWLQTYAVQPDVIEEIARKVIDAERLSKQLLGNDMGTAYDMMKGILCEYEEYEEVLIENAICHEHRKVQTDWKAHQMQMLKLEEKKKKMLQEYRQEDMVQKRESQLRLQQIIQQERMRQKSLDEKKRERRAIEMEAFDIECEQQIRVGRRIEERERVIYADLKRLPVRDRETDRFSMDEHMAFLKAFLQRLDLQRVQQQVRACP